MANFSTGIPEGVTKLDFGAFAIVLSPSGKIMLFPKGEGGKHVTIHLGGVSGILDAHVTDPHASVKHRALGGIRLPELTQLLEEVAPTIEGDLMAIMRRVLRPVRFGWLRHHNMVVLPFWPFTDGGLLDVGERRKRVWTADQERLISCIGRSLNQTEIETASGVAFNLFHPGRPKVYPYGMLFKYLDDHGRPRYMWFKADALMNELRKLWQQYQPAMSKLFVKPSDVQDAIPTS